MVVVFFGGCMTEDPWGTYEVSEIRRLMQHIIYTNTCLCMSFIELTMLQTVEVFVHPSYPFILGHL